MKVPVIVELCERMDEVNPAVAPPGNRTVKHRRHRWAREGVMPASRRRVGRTNNSKLTSIETGFPGSPKTGIPLPLSPKANGLAGLIATCIQRARPEQWSVMTVLT